MVIYIIHLHWWCTVKHKSKSKSRISCLYGSRDHAVLSPEPSESEGNSHHTFMLDETILQDSVLQGYDAAPLRNWFLTSTHIAFRPLKMKALCSLKQWEGVTQWRDVTSQNRLVKIEGTLRDAENQITQIRGLISQKNGVLDLTGVGTSRFAAILQFWVSEGNSKLAMSEGDGWPCDVLKSLNNLYLCVDLLARLGRGTAVLLLLELTEVSIFFKFYTWIV